MTSFIKYFLHPHNGLDFSSSVRPFDKKAPIGHRNAKDRINKIALIGANVTDIIAI